LSVNLICKSAPERENRDARRQVEVEAGRVGLEKVPPELPHLRRLGRLLVRAQGQPRHRVPVSPGAARRASASGTNNDIRAKHILEEMAI
jgi:hypothetical protein